MPQKEARKGSVDIERVAVRSSFLVIAVFRALGNKILSLVQRLQSSSTKLKKANASNNVVQLSEVH